MESLLFILIGVGMVVYGFFQLKSLEKQTESSLDSENLKNKFEVRAVFTIIGGIFVVIAGFMSL